MYRKERMYCVLLKVCKSFNKTTYLLYITNTYVRFLTIGTSSIGLKGISEN